jgi:hypothetical protein
MRSSIPEVLHLRIHALGLIRLGHVPGHLR